MSIIDFSKKAYEFIDWHANTQNPHKPKNHDHIIYPYAYDAYSEVQQKTFHIGNPTPLAGAFRVIENNSDVQQKQTVKFSEKTVNTITHTTVNGYKVGDGIKSTTKASLECSFIAAGKLEQSVEISVTGEYNHSSTDTNTNTVEKVWELTEEVQAPPKSRIVARLVIMRAKLQVPVKLTTYLYGTTRKEEYNFPALVGYDYDASRNYYPNWWDFAGYSLGAANWPGKPESFSYKEGDPSLIITGEGITTVDLGLYVTTRYDQFPISSPNYYEVSSDSNLDPLFSHTGSYDCIPTEAANGSSDCSGNTGGTTWYSKNILLADGRIIKVRK